MLARTERSPNAERRNRSATVAERVWSAVLAIAVVTPLVIAAFLRADPAGHGTHTQLGLPPCGWVVAYGKPCPTCGMTTAFTHAAVGRLDRAFLVQPAGTVFAVVAAGLFWAGLHTAVTGSRVGPAMLTGLQSRHAFGMIAVLLAGWITILVTFKPPAGVGVSGAGVGEVGSVGAVGADGRIEPRERRP